METGHFSSLPFESTNYVPLLPFSSNCKFVFLISSFARNPGFNNNRLRPGECKIPLLFHFLQGPAAKRTYTYALGSIFHRAISSPLRSISRGGRACRRNLLVSFSFICFLFSRSTRVSFPVAIFRLLLFFSPSNTHLKAELASLGGFPLTERTHARFQEEAVLEAPRRHSVGSGSTKAGFGGMHEPASVVSETLSRYNASTFKGRVRREREREAEEIG